MNKRMLSIIKDLSNLEKDISIDMLVKKYEVSSRTIRNDINAINESLESNNISPIKLLKGGFIYRELDFIKLLECLDIEDYYEYRLSKEERVKVAATMMVNSDDYITLATIADQLFVSRATIIEDLSDIKKLIQDAGLEVLSAPNKGQRVLGKESLKRRFLFRSRIEGENENNDEMIKAFSVKVGNQITIQKIMNEQEHIHKFFLDDESFVTLQMYLGIMIERNQKGNYIEPQEINDSSKFQMAQSIIKYICQYCNITTTMDEIYAFCTLLDRSRYVRKQKYNQEIIKIQMITRRFIDAISEDLEINLNTDYDFFEKLSNHLESVLTMKNTVFPENDVIKNIVQNNQYVHNIVKHNLKMLYSYSTRKFSELEIMYITLHVCAAIERRKNQDFVFHIALVCHIGMGPAQLLCERLKSHYNLDIVDIITAHEAKNLDSDVADLIITTIPIDNCKIDTVLISPYLNDEDYIHIGSKIDALRNSRNLPSRIEEKEVSAKGVLNIIRPIIYSQAPDNAKEIYGRIREAVRDYFNRNDEEDEALFAPYLHHLLHESHIQLDVECETAEEAIRKSAEYLITAGYIEPRYVDAIIENMHDNGPYFVLSPGFAVPHEGLDRGTIKLGMNLIRLKKPVYFDVEGYDPVEFVCCLSAVDHRSHLRAFFNLVNMLKNTDFKEALHMAKTPQEAAYIISHYEYTLGMDK